jgi:hypothetical protein
VSRRCGFHLRGAYKGYCGARGRAELHGRARNEIGTGNRDLSPTRCTSRIRGDAGDCRGIRRRRERLIAAVNCLAVCRRNHSEVISLIGCQRSERRGVRRNHRGVERSRRTIARRTSVLHLRRCRNVRRPINLCRVLCDVRRADLRDRRRSGVGIAVVRTNQSSASSQNQIQSEKCGANKPRGPFANCSFSSC